MSYKLPKVYKSLEFNGKIPSLSVGELTITLLRSFEGYLFVDRIMKAFSFELLMKGIIFYGLETSFWELSASCSEIIGSADYKLNSCLLNSGSDIYKF